MTKKRWVIVGATSAIARAFARTVAEKGDNLLLIARNAEELKVISDDCQLRFNIHSETISCDLNHDITALITILQQHPDELCLFLAASQIIGNHSLNSQNIDIMIQVNAIALAQLIHSYWKKQQDNHQVIFLSSVAACRGRIKNSLYGGSKALIEIYLQGLQQEANNKQKITIARLGFIDTTQTYGQEGIFFAASPEECALACFKANQRGKRQIYYPFFWRPIMWCIRHLPFFIYRKMKV